MKLAHYRAKASGVFCAAVLGLVVPAAAAGSDSLRVVVLETPAAENSLTPHLASGPDGLTLSWIERVDGGHVLRLARWDGKRFGPAATIHASDHFFANWADFPSTLRLADGRLVAHWLEKAARGTYEYDVWTSISDDDGANWSEPEKLHGDETLSEHGFVSLVPAGEHGFSAVWLDGREFGKGSGDDEMTLRFRTHDGARFGEEALLDGRVCECCQTGMARTENGLFVAYRNRSADEIRDIGVVRQVDDVWTKPRILHDDGWHIEGCPVNGPQVAARGHRLAVAWFSASGGDPRVQVMFSDDNGESFGEPIRINDADGAASGRVDVEWLGERAVVSWIENLEGREGEVRLKRVSPSGEAEPALTVARTASGRASGFPRMAVYAGELYVSWTESYSRKGPSQVKVAKVVDEMMLTDEPALDFEAEDLEGNVYRLSDLSGKVVLVNFWGIWCKSCRGEIPHLVELDERWRESGLVVLGADYGDEPEDLPAFVEEMGMSYPVLVDEGLADDYKVLVFPTSVVIDRNGRVRYRVEGYREESFEALMRVLERLLEAS